MIYGLYHSAAGMMTNEYRQAVLANNLANTDTVGFKRDIAVFAERLPASQAGVRDGPSAPEMEGLSGGLWLGRTSTDFSVGDKIRTDNPLDVVLETPGFLTVSAGGQRLYTRDGRMIVDPDGRLVAVTDGAPILGRGGAPIQVNPRGGQPTIDQDGRIRQDGHVVGELEIVNFPSDTPLLKTGGSRFVAPDGAAAPVAALVQSGHVESSGVKPLTELVSMIEASRAYQMNAQMISLQDQTVGRLISVITR
jgi:flagellar basal body rod protein FlgG